MVLGFHPAVAPLKAAVLPLTKKDGLPEVALEDLDGRPGEGPARRLVRRDEVGEDRHDEEREEGAGRADVFMTDYPFSRRMLALTDWARLLPPPATYHLTPYAWAVAPDGGVLVADDRRLLVRRRDGAEIGRAHV